MNWTKTVKDFAILLFLALCAFALLSDLYSVIFYHSKFFPTIFSLAKEIGGYAIRIGAVLVLTEISENVFAIRNGGKAPVAAAPAAKPAVKTVEKKEEKPAEKESAEKAEEK